MPGVVKSRLSLLIFLTFVFPFSAQAGPSSAEPAKSTVWRASFNTSSFATLIADEIREYEGSTVNVSQRLLQVRQTQQTWMKEAKIRGVLNRIVTPALLYQSASFIDLNASRNIQIPSFLRDFIAPTSITWPAVICGFTAMTGNELSSQLNTDDFVDYPDLTKVLDGGYRLMYRDAVSDPSFCSSIPEFSDFGFITDPLVVWLAKQKKYSVTEKALFLKAVQIYKDPFTALGVIGTVFDVERQSISNRGRQAILGSRIKPMFSNRKYDFIGNNYHFWAYLNIAILHGNFTDFLAHLENYGYEWVHQHDSAEYNTDKIALKLGAQIHHEIL